MFSIVYQEMWIKKFSSNTSACQVIENYQDLPTPTLSEVPVSPHAQVGTEWVVSETDQSSPVRAYSATVVTS